MLFQGKDGELRLYEKGAISGAEPSGTTYYFEILFTEMDFSGPTSRPKTEETLIMDRGNFDTNAHYIEGNDEPIYNPVNITFSTKIADTVNTQILSDWLSGVSRISNAASGASQIYSWDGGTSLAGNTTVGFKDADKMAYRVEVKWAGDPDYGLRYEEVYFTPGEQTLTESADNVMLAANGQVWGDVTRIAAFTSGTSILAFS
jgi:hypothetical protein